VGAIVFLLGGALGALLYRKHCSSGSGSGKAGGIKALTQAPAAAAVSPAGEEVFGHGSAEKGSAIRAPRAAAQRVNIRLLPQLSSQAAAAAPQALALAQQAQALAQALEQQALPTPSGTGTVTAVAEEWEGEEGGSGSAGRHGGARHPHPARALILPDSADAIEAPPTSGESSRTLPGGMSGTKAARQLAASTRAMGFKPEQHFDH
jgi:hypothetical protein